MDRMPLVYPCDLCAHAVHKLTGENHSYQDKLPCHWVVSLWVVWVRRLL